MRKMHCFIMYLFKCIFFVHKILWVIPCWAIKPSVVLAHTHTHHTRCGYTIRAYVIPNSRKQDFIVTFFLSRPH